VKASGLVGTGRSHAAALTDIPGLDDPHPRESHAGLLHQPLNDVLVDSVDVPFTRDTKRQFLESFNLHEPPLRRHTLTQRDLMFSERS
jgi:hypothetical protein